MPKPHDKKHHQKGVGTQLVGPADSLIDITIKDHKQNEWAKNQVTNEGPEHKQVLNALLLNNMAGLVKAIEAKTGMPFNLQPGETIISHKHDDEITIPIALPLQKEYTKNREEIMHSIAKAPEHESLVYAMLIQLAEWGHYALSLPK